MLRVRNISKKYDEFFLQDIDLEISAGDYFVLLGPSGAGKTILFETIAGLIDPDSGSILLEDRDITILPISKREVGIVFQDGAVFPHMTVRHNLSYALKSKKLNKAEINGIIEELAKKVSISKLLHRKPDSLSGGELQRVAIARTLALKPKILLLDEPLASLDVQLKQEIRDLLRKLHKSGQTILHITHDYREAFYLATRMAIMDKGKIIQQGIPAEVFLNPGNRFIASFMGINNYFRYKSITENEILIEDAVLVKVNNSKPLQGNVLIPQESISLLENKNEKASKSLFEGKITDIIEYPDQMELIIDMGIPLHIILSREKAISNRSLSNGSLFISFDPSKFVFVHGNL